MYDTLTHYVGLFKQHGGDVTSHTQLVLTWESIYYLEVTNQRDFTHADVTWQLRVARSVPAICIGRTSERQNRRRAVTTHGKQLSANLTELTPCCTHSCPSVCLSVWRYRPTQHRAFRFPRFWIFGSHKTYTVEPGYNDIALHDTSLIASDILWYQLIPHC
jgi:hypothetical protein